MSYPQNGDRIVTIDSVTSLAPCVYTVANYDVTLRSVVTTSPKIITRFKNYLSMAVLAQCTRCRRTVSNSVRAPFNLLTLKYTG